MEMVGLKSGLGLDRFDGFSEAWRVIREGRGPLETEIFPSLQKPPGSVPMLCRRFMRYEEAIMLVFDDLHTVARA
jgi:hypothetical protein